jgi:SLT domain-containing protein
MSKVAGQTERAANAMQRLQFYRSQGGGSSTQKVPAFAKGGIVTRPTLAIVGEGGESEYIVPESKAASFSANYLSGARGESALGNGNGGSATVNITTGPVLQQDGQRYVTLGDLESAMQQVVGTVLSNGRTSGGRRYAGIR